MELIAASSVDGSATASRWRSASEPGSDVELGGGVDALAGSDTRDVLDTDGEEDDAASVVSRGDVAPLVSP